MKRNRLVLAAAVVAVLAAAAYVQVSAASTANLAISANVSKNCSVATAPVAFGSYDPLSATPLDTTGTVTVNCTRTTAATVGLDLGQNVLTSARRMKSGTTEYLGYNLFSDSGRTTEWNNTATQGYTSASKNTAQVYTVYGRVAAGQDALALASYADTVVATVNF